MRLLSSLFVCWYGCARPADHPPPPIVDRVVVVGMDGLDLQAVEELIAAGRLPTLRRLLHEGAVAELALPAPILSPVIWTTYASGYPAADHGVVGWATEDGRAVTAADLRTRRVWDVASASGLRSVVVGWLMTWPAPPLLGAAVSDRWVWSLPMNRPLTTELVAVEARSRLDLAGLWSPASLDASGWAVDAAWEAQHPLAWQLQSVGAERHPLVRDERHLRAFIDLWAADPSARLGAVYFNEADQVSHLYWPFFDPTSSRGLRQDPDARMQARAALPPDDLRLVPLADRSLSADDLAEGARWVPAIYDNLDTSLARLLGVIDPTTTTLVLLSDHGFVGDPSPAVLGGQHQGPGLMVVWGRRAARGARLQADALDVAPTLAALLGLPAAADWQGQAVAAAITAAPSPAGPSWRLDASAAPAPAAADPGGAALTEQLQALGYVDGAGAPIDHPASREVRAAGSGAP